MWTRIKRIIARTLVAISLLLAAATLVAWNLSARHPWVTNPNSNSVVSGNATIVVVDRVSTWEWIIPWWTVLVLWLWFPAWRLVHWMNLGISSDARTGRLRWLIAKPSAVSISVESEATMMFRAHLLVSFPTIAIPAVYMLMSAWGDGDRTMAFVIGILFFLFAPIVLPFILIAGLEELYYETPQALVFTIAYLCFYVVAYIWLTDRLFKQLRRKKELLESIIG